MNDITEYEMALATLRSLIERMSAVPDQFSHAVAGELVDVHDTLALALPPALRGHRIVSAATGAAA